MSSEAKYPGSLYEIVGSGALARVALVRRNPNFAPSESELAQVAPLP